MLLSSSLAGPRSELVFRTCGVKERSADLVLSGAGARPDERIWAQIALNVGRDYFSRDTVAGHEPLVCARHGYREVCGEIVRERCGLCQCQKTGPSYGS